MEDNALQEPYLALLRGINAGGNNKLPMQHLVKLFTEAGCRDIRTYIQSGNVVFKASPALAADLGAEIPRRILEHAGLRVPVVMRTRDELAGVALRNPFLESGADPAALHVMFLADLPSAQALDRLDPRRSPSDSFAVVGREIYLHCPDGLARTKLTNAYFDAKLETTGTCRNWRTTLKLLEMAGA